MIAVYLPYLGYSNMEMKVLHSDPAFVPEDMYVAAGRNVDVALTSPLNRLQAGRGLYVG